MAVGAAIMSVVSAATVLVKVVRRRGRRWMVKREFSMRSLKLGRWSPLVAVLLGLCAAVACAEEDADTKSYTAIRKLGGFASRDEKRPGRPIVSVTFNGFLTGVDFKDQDLRELAPLLEKLPNLEELDLCTEVSDAGLKDVARFKRLRVLWLGWNVTDAGLKELSGLDQLSHLSIVANDKITGVGLRHLAGLRNLKSLSLFGSSLSDAGMKELVALKELQRLDVHGCSVTDSGVKELVGLKNLTRLDLSETKVTNAGLKHLAALKNLRTLRLYNTRVTVATINELQQALLFCRMEITAESQVE